MSIGGMIADLEDQLRETNSEIDALTAERDYIIIALDALRRVPERHSRAVESCPQSSEGRIECERPILPSYADDAELVGNPPTQQKLTSDAMARVLLDRPEGLHRKAILKLITEREGIIMRVQKPEKLVGQYLSQDGRFVSLGRGVWRLHDEIAKRYREDETKVVTLPLTERLNAYRQGGNGGQDAS